MVERLTTDRWARLVASLEEAAATISEGRRQIEDLHAVATALHERAKHELEQARLRLAWAEAGLRPSLPAADDPDQP
jgi:hypothetical protein